MGQAIPDHIRRVLIGRHDILEVTKEHVVLRRGTVLDPNGFALRERPMRFVLKLIACNCALWRHQVGTHVIVDGVVIEYADGSHRNVFDKPHWCRHGAWTCEEVLKRRVTIKHF